MDEIGEDEYENFGYSLKDRYKINKMIKSPLGRISIHVDGKQNINGINLYGNPLEEPPIEVVKQGKEAIRMYFRDKK